MDKKLKSKINSNKHCKACRGIPNILRKGSIYEEYIDSLHEINTSEHPKPSKIKPKKEN